jgi:hypothetical protein
MKKLLVLALGFALMACTNPMTADEEVPAVETEAEMMEEGAATEEAVVEEATEEVAEEAATE